MVKKITIGTIQKCVVCGLHKKIRRRMMCRPCHDKYLYEKNPESYKHALEHVSKYQKEHRKERSDYKRKWRNKTGKEVIAQTKKFHNDINYRIYHIFASTVHHAIRNNKKIVPSFERVTGYPFSDLKIHLELKFRNRMSWDNYGKVWNIDHILSRRKFNYKSRDDSEFKKFWALDNVQPLFVKENMRKQEFTKVPK